MTRLSKAKAEGIFMEKIKEKKKNAKGMALHWLRTREKYKSVK